MLYLATFAMTKERVQPELGQKTSLRDDIKDLFNNRPWVVLSFVGIAALTYANIRGTVAIFYFENVVPGGKDYFGPVMTTGAVAFILGVMATAPLSKRFGKRNFYMVAMALTAVLSAAFYFVPPENTALVWASHALISLVVAPTAPLVWAMYANTADHSEWRCGRRATGLIFSASSFAQKFGSAIGGAGAGWLLAYFGYQPNSTQSADTVHGIVLMMSLIPSLGAVIAVIALWFYTIDEATVEKMSADLAARRAGLAGKAGTEPTPAATAEPPSPAVPAAPATEPTPFRRSQWQAPPPPLTQQPPLPRSQHQPVQPLAPAAAPPGKALQACRKSRRCRRRRLRRCAVSSSKRFRPVCMACASAPTCKARRPVTRSAKPRSGRGWRSCARMRAGCAASLAPMAMSTRLASPMNWA